MAYDGPLHPLKADIFAIIREAGTPPPAMAVPLPPIANAIEALEKQLSFVGWVEAGEVYRLCALSGISRTGLSRARIALDLKRGCALESRRTRRIYWHRPELEPAAVAAEIINLNKQTQLPL